MRLVPGRLDRSAQEGLLAEIRAVVAAAPLFVPRMPRTGKPFSVRMTNCGPLGWVSDETRLSLPGHASDDRRALAADAGLPASAVGGPRRLPRAARGLPRQLLRRRRQDGAAPGSRRSGPRRPGALVSLGDTCLFRVGGTRRADPTRSFRLASGDVMLLDGESRLAFHGVDRLYPGTSTLLQGWRAHQPDAAPCHHTLRPVKGAEDGRHGAGSGARPTMPSQVEANTQLLFSSEDAPCDVRSQAGPHESSRGS